MFDEDELEALVLGARWVGRQGDEPLARAAVNAIAKIAAAAPEGSARRCRRQRPLRAAGVGPVATTGRICR